MLLFYLVCLRLLWFSSGLRDHGVKSKSFLYPKYRHEMFYDNKIMPEDTEVDVFLHRGHVHKLYFILESGYRPISVTVTPCSTDAILEWKISHSIFQNHPSDPSYRSATWSNHVIRPLSPSAAYVGRERRSYTNPRAPPGLYTLELRSKEESRASAVLTLRPTSQSPYHPPLPPEPGVNIVKIKRNRILVEWKPSLSTRPVEYCVTSNNRRNFNSLCSVKSHHPSLPLTCVGRKTWHLFKGLQRGRTYYFDVYVVDVATNASSVYVGVSATLRGSADDASPKVKDDSLVMFALNASNGYEVNAKYHVGRDAAPLLIFIQSCTGPGPVNLHITDPTTRHELMSTTVTDAKTLQLPLPANSSTLVFSVRSTTSHPRHVRLWLTTSHKRRQTPFPALPGDKSVRVFDTLTSCDSVTLGWKTSPDERVKYCVYAQAARDELTRRTLAEPQNFCAAQTKHPYVGIRSDTRRYGSIGDHSDRSRRYEPTSEHTGIQSDRSGRYEPSSDRTGIHSDRSSRYEPSSDYINGRRTVLCRRYHRFSKRRFSNLVMQRVKGLRPGTRYLFEVQVTKVKGQMLPYEQVWAMTHDTCSRSKR